jgi:hypothetical protein
MKVDLLRGPQKSVKYVNFDKPVQRFNYDKHTTLISHLTTLNDLFISDYQDIDEMFISFKKVPQHRKWNSSKELADDRRFVWSSSSSYLSLLVRM